ncbi:Thymidine kinase [Isoptericola dokdonensis DS-3]|uniref:Thymidine kinase n=2 Tax=Isoptericola TaxID=254250 RepID=A0A168E8Y7_9MICO|nr:Thymidine kinase [Isoptericola dokdonensis DS-3]
MFAGKSTELVRRVERARIAGRGTLVVAHDLDVRSGAGRVATHSGLGVDSVSVADAAAIVPLVTAGLTLVAVDEAQFFGPALVDVVQGLADDGLDVVVAGLTVTFDGQPFEPLPSLMALAESVTRLTAVCVVCGRDAAYHVRLVPDDGDPRVASPTHVGGAETYEARCRAHRSPGRQ